MIAISAPQLEFLVNEWLRCEPMLQRVIDEAENMVDLDYVWSEVISERSQFWPMPRAVIVTRIEVYPSGVKALLHWLCGGDDLDDMRATEATIAKWAKKQGCTRSEIVGRRGWLRALKDYREGSTIMVKELA